MCRLISVFLFYCLSSTAIAQQIPDFSANYLVELNGLQAGELKRTLSTEAVGTRRLHSITQAKGMFAFFKPDVVEETSVWQEIDGQITPQHYLYQRSGGKKDKTLSMDFNWKRNIARIDDKQHPWKLKLEPNTLDKLNYQINLMQDLAQGDTVLSYRIADGGKLKTYDIEILGTETISTPMGHIETIKLTRHRDKDEDRDTTLWCAPKLNFLPVKLEHIEDSARFTAVIRRLQGIETDHAFTSLDTTSTLKAP